jgi:hypothetical protein
MVQTMALNSWRSKFEREPSPADVLGEWGITTGAAQPAETENDMTGAAYVIDDIVDEIVRSYTVTTKERRSGERRSEGPRRKDES